MFYKKPNTLKELVTTIQNRFQYKQVLVKIDNCLPFMRVKDIMNSMASIVSSRNLKNSIQFTVCINGDLNKTMNIIVI